jgi:site-specific DNA-methyltransferase (adenine-specific)
MIRFQIHNQDAESFLQQSEELIDLTVCSPPYKKSDGYNFQKMLHIFALIKRQSRENALCFVNFGHLAHHKGDPYRLALAMEAIGWTWHDTIVWYKHGHYTPLPDPHLNNLWEPIFLFCNGDKPKLDRLSIGVPFKDKSNVDRYGKGKDLRCAGNLWFIDYETITNKEQKTHKDRFPVELPRRCVKLSGIKKGSIVYDPFSGSGTTGVAALELGMHYTGTEILPDIAQKSVDRLSKVSEHVA